MQGRRESLRGPGQNICDDCFNRAFDCSIRVYRSFGAHKQSGAQGKMPQLPPPLGGPGNMLDPPLYTYAACSNKSNIIICNTETIHYSYNYEPKFYINYTYMHKHASYQAVY